MGCGHCGYGEYDVACRFEGNVRQLAEFAGLSLSEAKELAQKHADTPEGREGDVIIKHAECARGCSVPSTADPMVKGLASEGYWGL